MDISLDEPPGLRVVFLDDESTMRDAFVGAAAAHGIAATAVSTPAEARDEIEGARVDLAVLDFDLGDGQTSAGLVRELIGAGSLIVVWTGDAERAREALGPMTTVVPKSANVTPLFREVSRLIHERASALAAAVESGDLDAV